MDQFIQFQLKNENFDLQREDSFQKKCQESTGAGSNVSQNQKINKKKPNKFQFDPFCQTYEDELFIEDSYNEEQQSQSHLSSVEKDQQINQFLPDANYQIYQSNDDDLIFFLHQQQRQTEQKQKEEKKILNGKINSFQDQYQINFKKLQQNLGKNILVGKDRKNLIQRNKNLPKFVCRAFIKYFKNYQVQYKNYPQIFLQVSERCKKLDKWTKKQKKNALNISHLLQLLNGIREDFVQSKINRKVVRLILKDHMKQEIIFNGQLKKKKTYMNMIKVFILRCCHQSLVRRMQAK